ncbi:hypothetical protein COLO4_00430 [Corchorus olitorius]|uniref:Uncharacterized protein n=1 Tax=Corchorus olitorius TaxID=93759 RepID=A0A1R3L3S8_9ROSI|nr:hypothetical protein COLO4_00430 [Corchorus olitorius]
MEECNRFSFNQFSASDYQIRFSNRYFIVQCLFYYQTRRDGRHPFPTNAYTSSQSRFFSTDTSHSSATTRKKWDGSSQAAFEERVP